MTRSDLGLVDGDGAAPGREAAIPLGRLGEAADVADTVIFAVSDLARYFNGTSIVVDGGMLSS